MEYHDKLYGFMKQHKLKDALYITGSLVNNNEIEILQKTWIHAIASIGDYSNVCFMKWYDTCKTMDVFIQSEEFNIKEAFLISAKICILFENMIHYIVIPKKTIAQLRANTISYFSKNTSLSEAGMKLFEEILPKAINERDFCIQIISTLIKLWSSNNHLILRDGIEYLCRKDYKIESLEYSNKESDIVSYIWCFFEIYQRDNSISLYSIYKTDYKKKEKSWRTSLLLGIHNCVNNDYKTISWSENEVNILEKTEVFSKDMWGLVISSRLKEKKEEDKEKDATIDKLEVFESYFPKVNECINECENEEEIDLKNNIKHIYISKRKCKK